MTEIATHVPASAAPQAHRERPVELIESDMTAAMAAHDASAFQ
jgi:hypothetical protein